MITFRLGSIEIKGICEIEIPVLKSNKSKNKSHIHSPSFGKIQTLPQINMNYTFFILIILINEYSEFIFL